jgi:hypothetical protein
MQRVQHTAPSPPKRASRQAASGHSPQLAVQTTYDTTFSSAPSANTVEQAAPFVKHPIHLPSTALAAPASLMI